MAGGYPGIVEIVEDLPRDAETIRVLRETDPDCEITLIAPRAELHYLPSIIWIPSGLRTRKDLVTPLTAFFGRHRVQFHQGTVQTISSDGRTVLTDRGEVSNDGLIIASGGRFIKKLPGIKDAFIVEPPAPPTSGPQAGQQALDGLLSGVAIIAESWWAAKTARKQLEIKWDEGTTASQSSESFAAAAAALSKQAPARSVRKDGDPDTAFASAAVPLTVISSLLAPPAITLKPAPTVIFSTPPTASLSVITTVLPSPWTSSLPSSPRMAFAPSLAWASSGPMNL
mgnify:CR=1 FL=1